MHLNERVAHICTPIHLCMNKVKYAHVLPKGVYVKVLLTYMYTHVKTCPLCMYDDLVNRGSLQRCSQGYSKLDGA